MPRAHPSLLLQSTTIRKIMADDERDPNYCHIHREIEDPTPIPPENDCE